MKLRILLIALAGCLMLSACGGPDNNLLSGDYVLLPPMVYPK